jgi:hypothetical protein
MIGIAGSLVAARRRRAIGRRPARDEVEALRPACRSGTRRGIGIVLADAGSGSCWLQVALKR